MTEKLETEIMQLSNMIDGINIALERAKELREKFIFNYEPFESSEPLTFGFDTLIELLREDKGELSDEMKELQKRLEIKPEIFEDGINPDPDDWDSELEAIKEDDQSLRDHVNRRL